MGVCFASTSFDIDKSIYSTFPTSFVVLPNPSLFAALLLHQQFTTDEEVAQLCSTNVTEATQTEPASFPDFYTSMFNLLVLITTANHPDVILQEYIENRAVAIFSMVFLGVGLYVFMNILTAIVYSEFRGYLASSVQSRLTRRRVATRAAFEVLRFAVKESDVVTSDQVIKLIDNVRISRWKKEALRVSSVQSRLTRRRVATRAAFEVLRFAVNGSY
ncbi:hypothetical protein AHF37_07796 [Paragonimus kellicotti]|nr:hypothetical protein AHF37_07796 [Paragonimus kellicotti]